MPVIDEKKEGSREVLSGRGGSVTRAGEGHPWLSKYQKGSQ